MTLTARALASVLALLTGLAFMATTAAPAQAHSDHWAFEAMGIRPDRPRGDDVRVAVVDSGLDAGHPAFSGRVVRTVDCIGSAGDADKCRDGGTDDNGHGTHIAGIVAAKPARGGVEGVAPHADILAVRSLKNTCTDEGDESTCQALGELGDVVAGVVWAIEHRADIINLSIDAGVDLDWDDGDLADAVRTAWAKGIIVVASAGNRSETIDDVDLRSVPVVLVGATDATGGRAAYSNVAPSAKWSVLAPGGEAGGACPDAAVLSTFPRVLAAAGTGCLAGTSMAAAYVSGALASLISSGLDSRDALAHLIETALPTPEGRVVNLGTALDTPFAGAAPPRVEEATTSAPFGLVWTQVHPVRARAIGATWALLAAALLVVHARRRRRETVLAGF